MALSTATSADYERHLLSLRPRGPAWAAEDPHLAAVAAELARAHGRAVQLVDEADPRTTGELLPDWERVTGLPDDCLVALGISQTTAQRIDSLVARLTTVGGQSGAYFVQLAASLGYAITVTEFDLHDVTDDVDAGLYAEPWQYVWEVSAVQDEVGVFSVADTADDPLAWWGNESLECVIRRLKPAHTHVIFTYA